MLGRILAVINRLIISDNFSGELQNTSSVIAAVWQDILVPCVQQTSSCSLLAGLEENQRLGIMC